MLKKLIRRMRALVARDRLEHELDEELRFHIDRETEQNIARGMPRDAARKAALVAFGGMESTKEDARDARGVRLAEETWQDVRYGIRMLRKAPGFTAVAVVSLGLGIGANTALFSVVDAVLLEKLPVKEPDRLVLFEWQAGKAFRTSGMSGYGAGDTPPGRRASSSFHYRTFEAMRQQESAVAELFAFADLWDANVLVDGDAARESGQFVSGNYFEGLGVRPLLGRAIAPADDDPSAPPVVVVSHRYWRERFNADPAAVGKQISINSIGFTIVGVAPPGFDGTLQVGAHPAVMVPLALEPALDGDRAEMERPGEPGTWFLHIMGRLEPGATLEQARDSLDAAFQSVALEIMPEPKRATDVARLEPKDYPTLVARTGSRGLTERRRVYTSTIYLLFGVVGLVLLIACANVANMLLARSTSRANEITLRLAVGAGRARLVRQLLTESLLLALLGGALGVLLAVWGTELLSALADRRGGLLPQGVVYGVSWRVLAFTTGASVLTGVVFGLIPAWRTTRPALTSALKENSRAAGSLSRSRLSKALVVAQVAMSLVLLLAAGLFVRTVRNLEHVPLGFNEKNLLMFTVQSRRSGYEGARLFEFYRQVFARLEAIPGVRSATFEHIPLISDTINDTNVLLPGETERTAAEHDTNREIVRENYFETMEIPLVRGRGFTPRDDAAAPRVCVVNETFAREFFPDRDPIGARIGFDDKTAETVEIVGVARDTKYNSQRDEMHPLTYTSWLQEADQIGRMTFVVRTSPDPLTLGPAVREAVRDVDATVPVMDVTTQEALSATTFSSERTLADLLTFFGALALALAAIGLYGVMAYSVAQRTKEIGIRMALGAEALQIVRLVVEQGMRFALVGLAIGVAGAWMLKRIVESRLYGVEPADPATFTVVALVLVGAAFIACWIPARRATRVDPVEALRSE